MRYFNFPEQYVFREIRRYIENRIQGCGVCVIFQDSTAGQVSRFADPIGDLIFGIRFFRDRIRSKRQFITEFLPDQVFSEFLGKILSLQLGGTYI